MAIFGIKIAVFHKNMPFFDFEQTFIKEPETFTQVYFDGHMLTVEHTSSRPKHCKLQATDEPGFRSLGMGDRLGSTEVLVSFLRLGLCWLEQNH